MTVAVAVTVRPVTLVLNVVVVVPGIAMARVGDVDGLWTVPVGTNVAVMNGLLHLVIEAGRIDRRFLDRRTVGFERLRETVAEYSPERVEEIAGIEDP